MNNETNCIECGALFPKPPPEGGAAGYAIIQDQRVCYPCADRYERIVMNCATAHVAYLSSDGRKITTWTGGELGIVISARPCKLARRSFTHSASSFVSVRVRAFDGSVWYGRGSPGIAIRLRKAGKS